jgi:hypothetical protein
MMMDTKAHDGPSHTEFQARNGTSATRAGAWSDNVCQERFCATEIWWWWYYYSNNSCQHSNNKDENHLLTTTMSVEEHMYIFQICLSPQISRHLFFR